ncbi:MAG: heme exporter protein CcmB [bacterium]
MTSALRHFAIILWKDLLIDLRRKENILAMFFFSLLTLLIFQFALGGGEKTRFNLTPRALQNLQALGLGPDAAQGLEPLLGRSFATQGAMLKALDAGGGWRPTGAERIAILRASRRTILQESAPGLLWVAFLLAGVLGLGKSFGQERENGCMEALLLTPMDRGVLYLGKMASNAFFLVVLLLLLVPTGFLLFNLSARGIWLPLGLVFLGGVVGFSALGTLLGGITSTLRGKEVLLPLLLFPLMAPILISVVRLTVVILEGGDLSREMGWVNLVAAADAMYLILSYLVFEYVMEA